MDSSSFDFLLKCIFLELTIKESKNELDGILFCLLFLLGVLSCFSLWIVVSSQSLFCYFCLFVFFTSMCNCVLFLLAIYLNIIDHSRQANQQSFHLDLIHKQTKMFILSDLYRVAINIGDRALTPSMKRVLNNGRFPS